MQWLFLSLSPIWLRDKKSKQIKSESQNLLWSEPSACLGFWCLTRRCKNMTISVFNELILLRILLYKSWCHFLSARKKQWLVPRFISQTCLVKCYGKSLYYWLLTRQHEARCSLQIWNSNQAFVRRPDSSGGASLPTVRTRNQKEKWHSSDFWVQLQLRQQLCNFLFFCGWRGFWREAVAQNFIFLFAAGVIVANNITVDSISRSECKASFGSGGCIV